AVNRILIRHARVLDPASGLDTTGDVLIEGEGIAAVGGDLSAAARDAETIQAEGLCLAPGLVDMRVQLREPGAEHLESIESGGGGPPTADTRAPTLFRSSSPSPAAPASPGSPRCTPTRRRPRD